MTETHPAHAHYLDASALTQLATCTNPDHPLREFFQANLHFLATTAALAQAISLLRERRRNNRGLGVGRLFADEYFAAIRFLLVGAWGKRIELDDIELFNLHLHEQVEQIATKYQLSFQDALQLALIKKHHEADSEKAWRPVLITASDGPLQRAAALEGIPVWNCAGLTAPQWDR